METSEWGKPLTSQDASALLDIVTNRKIPARVKIEFAKKLGYSVTSVADIKRMVAHETPRLEREVREAEAARRAAGWVEDKF
jgi:hypothetical protein